MKFHHENNIPTSERGAQNNEINNRATNNLGNLRALK